MVISCSFFKKDEPVEQVKAVEYSEPEPESKSKMLWIRGANRIQSQVKHKKFK